MAVKIRSRVGRCVFLSGVWLFFAVYSIAVFRQFRASRLMLQLDAGALEKAARIEPWNAEIPWRLGRYWLWIGQDPQAALRELKAALAKNPHVARYWLDSAAAYQACGDLQGQRSSLESALARDPTSPNVAWEAANSYLVSNNLPQALSLFRAVMKTDPERVDSALQTTWRATQDIDIMLDQAISPAANVYFSFLNLLLKNDETAEAKLVWDRLVGQRMDFPVAHAYPFVDYLLRVHAVDQAVAVWQELLKRLPRRRDHKQPGNLISNGDFEEDFLNAGLDWRYSARHGVRVSLDQRKFHGGTRSLATHFDGPAVDRVGIFEYVPVRPNATYHFSLYSKVEELESASGPRIEIVDAYSERSYLLSDDSVGTTEWREQSADFHTGAESTLLIVRVVRQPSEPLIKGTFWIDDVNLVERSRKR